MDQRHPRRAGNRGAASSGNTRRVLDDTTARPRLRHRVSFYLAFQRMTPVPEVRTMAATNSVVIIIDLDPPRRRRLTGPRSPAVQDSYPESPL
ncbi:hypothetical protein CFP75_34050 [Amycolatopsis alba DSM 44262]|uniref:Uncharacterized protein n=1 Tax=Amycolatopsis alba DSM 44262 TaxID=1125972 RepID=A0A229RD32_AMYAL|nr:hypothetical protein CFP75_34050 [Amycolatopsis alba DSM 44262]